MWDDLHIAQEWGKEGGEEEEDGLLLLLLFLPLPRQIERV